MSDTVTDYGSIYNAIRAENERLRARVAELEKQQEDAGRYYNAHDSDLRQFMQKQEAELAKLRARVAELEEQLSIRRWNEVAGEAVAEAEQRITELETELAALRAERQEPTLDTSEELRIYDIGPDKVIARDKQDAIAVWEEWSGEDLSSEDWEGIEPEEWPEDVPLTIANVDYEGSRETLSPQEWVKKVGRGFLCSENY